MSVGNSCLNVCSSDCLTASLSIVDFILELYRSVLLFGDGAGAVSQMRKSTGREPRDPASHVLLLGFHKNERGYHPALCCMDITPDQSPDAKS